MSKWLIPKAVLAVLLVAGFAAAQRILYPSIVNPSAVSQVDDSAGSFIQVTAVDGLMRFGWLIVLAIVVLLFIPDVIRLVRQRSARTDKTLGA